MKISRRNLIKAGIAAGAALSIPSVVRAQTASNDARTVHMGGGGGSFALSSFDPIYSTSDDVTNYGAAIYETLFALDSKFMPQPQMVGKWAVSDDKKTYTFELREGLGWHDGTPVTAADCVASIRRWAEVNPAGKLIMERASDISKKDDKTFTIALNEPLGTLIDFLANISPPVPFIMREKDASRPASEQVTTKIGSGPFKFNEALARPGASYTYDRNEKYVARKEPSDGFAGGKIVKVDRVIWDVIADQQTAVAALQAGEIDYCGVPPDLYPLIESDPNLQLEVLDKGGQDVILRMNFLQPPFDNVKARQAMLHLIDQEALMRAGWGDSKHIGIVTSIFGQDTPISNDENIGWFKKGGDPERAKQLFQEAGYAGEKVVILQPTDWAEASNASQLLAATLRKIGLNVELAPMSWAELSTRRANKGPVENGGWNLFITSDNEHSLGNPLTDSIPVASGDKAWYGWPKNDEYEALRMKFADVATLDERKALARKMQGIWWDFVGDLRLGKHVSPIAHRKTLTGLIHMPQILAMWNLQKVSA
ncbi:ABC transporter substrate-binding protein [Mesorhizobium sp. M8A.F.Ca.ET.165.01.1.1]|uniref:ABC transporter substrate-binding protein n=1 Tax=Mesorhizobium sp. M8A.F.Ca.ET.165.01.1.1 TaxID=2563960 RepID=UPI0010939E92|nr:ABC transporter substrate-binding protein [Mesorhizobium sp. M8A.F.Ca.ET.165.01.1.1]TGT35747.1 ABC transporter substrate-binding protein [Mesorhizobium sp. M8A.F.Ca.ET.165.01.1.1]